MKLNNAFLSSVCIEVKLALLLGPAMILMAFFLSGCWSRSSKIPEPATTNSLSGAEGSLDKLTDKRLSRVSAAIETAASESDAKNNVIINGELRVAKAMIGEPTEADLKFAKERAAKGDESFYLEQITVSKQLASAIIDANNRYEEEKQKKDAEYKAGLKQKEMELKAEQDARNADKWTYAGIGTFFLGLTIFWFGPGAKAKGFGVVLLVGGIISGAIPMVQNEPWFKGGIVGVIGLLVVSVIGFLIYSSKKESECLVKQNGTNVTNTTPPSA
jgi:hypothetical protein